MKTLIIDDEKDSHIVLKDCMDAHHREIQILSSGYSVEEGEKLIQQCEPELIFLDIEMPDGSGFDLLDLCQQKGLLNFQVIFITAHNQYAQTAISFGALDYLLKPINPAELSAAILKAQVKKLEKIQQKQMAIIKDSLLKMSLNELPFKIGVTTSDGIIYLFTKDLIRLEANGNYTEFYVENNIHDKRILANFNLKKYEN